MAIYEVNIRQYTPQGTFKAFMEHLPRLKEMGVGIIWLMPIHPIGKKKRKGSLGSYYAVADYKGVNAEFGTKEDFRALVDKIHEMGMYVILDWVANHSAWDNPWAQSNPEFYTKNAEGNFVPPFADWSDVIDFDYSNKKLWTAMIDALKYWVKEYDVDGYRCDVAAIVPLEFWQHARIELDKIKTVFMLAEAHEPEMHQQAFNMTYNWQLKDIINDIAKGKKNATALIKHLEEEHQKYPPGAYRMSFTTNHDENSWSGTVYERLGDAVEVFAVLCCTWEGMPLIYSGQEAGLNKRLEFFEKDTIQWQPHPFADMYSKLLHLKKNNKAIWNGKEAGKVKLIHANRGILVFKRKKKRTAFWFY